ncbi:MAG: hypothetical protein GY770_35345, partial [Aestuariibacter sp.]|nr:hypothetical protein [Aestuariibacter sp.]
DLTSTPQNTFDADGDAVKNIFNWYKDTNPIQVLNMPFEGGSDGSSTKDYSDSANNGTVDGPTWNATGGHDGKGAYEFDGTNDKIDFGAADPGIGGSSEATWSAWVKPSSVSGVQAIFQKEHNGGWAVFLNNTSMGFWDGGGATQDASLVVGEWAHLVWVFNSGEMEFYKNGIHLGTQSTGSNIINDQAGVNLCIGLKGVNSGEDFSGTIDDIQIFNHSLSAEQIANLSNGDVNIIDSEETTAGETWQSSVTPNDGTEDGTTKFSNNLTIINIAPTGANGTVVTNEDTAHTFTAADFNFSDPDGDTLASIKITALEAVGALQLNGVDVTLNQVITKAEIDSNLLKFVPDANTYGNNYDSFEFSVNDGTTDSASSYTMTVDVTTTANSVPSFFQNTASFTNHTIPGDAGTNVGYLSVADINGDGIMDVVTGDRSTETTQLYWYEHDGAGGFTRHAVSSASNVITSVNTADVD